MKFYLSLRRLLQRHRRIAIGLSAAFLIFEISRAVSIGQLFLPAWEQAAGERIESLLSRPPWIVAVTLALAFIFFAAPMAGAVYAALKIRRKLSRYWTGVNRQG